MKLALSNDAQNFFETFYDHLKCFKTIKGGGGKATPKSAIWDSPYEFLNFGVGGSFRPLFAGNGNFCVQFTKLL